MSTLDMVDPSALMQIRSHRRAPPRPSRGLSPAHMRDRLGIDRDLNNTCSRWSGMGYCSASSGGGMWEREAYDVLDEDEEGHNAYTPLVHCHS
jgi:hypothetical protein